jgi:hypothetical protein
VKKNGFRFRKPGNLLFGFTLFFLILTTYYFHWDVLQNMGGIVGKLVLTLQFPYRFLELACLTASVLAGFVLLYLKEHCEGFWYRSVMTLLLAASFFFCAFQLDHLMESHGFARVYNKQSMGTIYVSNGEYLPSQSQISLMQPDVIAADENTHVEFYEKGQCTLETIVRIQNDGTDGYVELPILFYKGYAARDTQTGQYLETAAGDNGAVPASYEGTIRVWFREPWYWRMGEAASALAFLWMLVRMRKKNGRRISHEKAQVMEK